MSNKPLFSVYRGLNHIQRNPNFYVFNAVLYLDKATPLWHYMQGSGTQNGIAQALKEIGHGVIKDAIARWK